MYIIHSHHLTGTPFSIEVLATSIEEVFDFINRNNLNYDYISEPNVEVTL